MGADLGNVSTRFEDTSSSSSSDLGSISTGGVKVVDKIIGSSVIPRRVVGKENVAIAVEKFSSPNIEKPSISASAVAISGGMLKPSPEELQAMTAQAPDGLAETKKADTTSTPSLNLRGLFGDGSGFGLGGFYLIVGAVGIFVIYKIVKKL
jgi:hypothetical protein